MMNRYLLHAALALVCASSPAWSVERGHSAAKAISSPSRQVVVNPARDQIIPLFYDGAGWSTNFVFTNLDNHAINIQLEFYGSDGSSLYIPVNGVGSTSAVAISIAQGGTISLDTSDFASSRTGGYAYVYGVNKTDLFSGYAVVRNTTANLPDLEYTVPVSPLNENIFTLAFDNSFGWDTAVSLVNSAQGPVSILVSALDQNGNQIATDTINLPAFGWTYFSTSAQYPQLAGIPASIDFTVSNGQLLTGIGLRIGPNQSVTTVPVFSFPH